MRQPGERIASPALQRFSLFAAVAPLATGLGILFLFWLTEWGIFPLIGLLALVGGGVVVLIGLAANVVYLLQARVATINRSAALLRGTVSLVLLLLNIPAAVFCAMVGTGLVFSPRVNFIVQNRGTSPIDDGRTVHANKAASFGTIPAGGSATTSLRIDAAGPLYCEFKRNGTVTRQEVCSYADGDTFRGGGKCTIKIDDAGATQIYD